MTWVRQAPTTKHVCVPPMRGGYVSRPAGSGGDLWRCDGCHELWRISDGFLAKTWRRAWWWQRVRYQPESR